MSRFMIVEYNSLGIYEEDFKMIGRKTSGTVKTLKDAQVKEETTQLFTCLVRSDYADQRKNTEFLQFQLHF